MKNLKRIVSFLLVAIMLISTVPAISAASVTFTDVADHWAWKQGQIPYLADKGVINGIKQSNGTYKFEPESPVTRAQFVKMLVETFGLTETTGINYNDVKSSDWFYTHFQKAAAQGFLLNYGKTVNPNANIPREEAVALIMRYLALETNEIASESTFTDTNKISSYYRQDVLQAVGAGIINGIKQKDGTYKFEPQSTLKRSEALTIIYKAVGCIFNKTTSGRDNGAYTTNNIINKSGITISGVTFTGRNLITEGAAGGKVTLSGCRVNGTLYVRGTAELVLSNTTADEIIILGGGKVTLQNSSVVNVLTIDKSNTIALTSGTIGELNIKAMATGVSVTGTGTIQNATITASGFKSSTVPQNYDIAGGLTATFGTTVYEGNSAAAKAYLSTPYASSDGIHYTVNVKTGYSGKIRLYYTNNSAKPSTTEFDVYYANSQYTTSFDVKANETTSQKTFQANAVGKFKYVVLQLISGPTKYAPVVVSNAVLTGDGFNADPELTGSTTVSYTPESAGTVYWFYSDSGEALNQAEFLEAYAEKESALKGKATTSANKKATLSLNSRYMANYPFIVFMASNTAGVNYNPILLAIGENGFKDEPVLVSSGSINFTSSVDGKLYFYFSDTATIPDTDEYYDIWREKSTSLRSSMTVDEDVEDNFVFNTRYTNLYPYMIIALEDDNNEFYTAVAVYINYTTGFKAQAVVDAANDTVTLETEAAGTIEYYYTNSNKLPTAEEFDEIYETTARAYKGSETVSTSKVVKLDITSSYITKYPYMVIKFTDTNYGVYYPIIVDLSQDYTEKSGFATTPKYNSTTGNITFSVYTDSVVMYYFTDETNPSTSEDDFYADWLSEGGKQTTATANRTTSIAADKTAKYAVIAVMIESDYTDEDSVSIVAVKLDETSSGGESLTGTGFTYEIMNANLFIMPKASGTLYYYLTNSTSKFPDGDFMSAFSANGGKTVGVTNNNVTHLSCGQTYVVLCLKTSVGDTYDYLILNTKTNQPVQENLPTDYGFEYELEDYLEALTSYSFTFKATVSGKFTTYVVVGSNKTKVEKLTFNVTAGSTYTVDFADQIAILENYQTTGYITFQITGYKEFSIAPQK